MSTLLLVGGAVALGALYASARAAVTVCVLEIRRGKVRVARGALAARLLTDVEDIARTPPIAHATVRVTRRRGRAELTLRGDLSEAQTQRIRNVIGSVPLAALRNSPRARR